MTKTLAGYGRAGLGCLGELGCPELGRRGAGLLFEVFTEREERASIAVTSNASLGWLDQDLHRPSFRAAIAGRPIFGGNIVKTGADSCGLPTPGQLTRTGKTGPRPGVASQPVFCPCHGRTGWVPAPAICWPDLCRGAAEIASVGRLLSGAGGAASPSGSRWVTR